MEQIVERKEKPVMRIFLVVLAAALSIDFIIFFLNKINKTLPYISTLITIALVVLSCSYILIKYFSKYSYTLEEEYLVFHRIIGSKRFEMLRVHYSDLIGILPKGKVNNLKKPSYKFIFDKNSELIYVGKFKENEKSMTFLFSPSEEILVHLKEKMKKRSEKHG
ncbi:hypothetical protein EDD65_107106 [Keratinibaculum paraultunense]|uniref:PH (Pleckstrin Homology) domain-containing protein n=1 Tax=Keratinibaculum paraultunense TaxID=1278232 RepID=A0A4R3KWB3_9FIRM|nr:hypothetical protein [Keratinibaculum paraultunense]QQY79865.1 hypothetical protein JL105_00580 [Keratinibaculum paraultunense]TCS88750.1 hypothetical protein EDD65_107106 [Keratinibaculum paraultunense]